MSTKQESKTTVSHLPEHGPIDENGREILLQVKNVDITFGKGDDAVKAVKNASFDKIIAICLFSIPRML